MSYLLARFIKDPMTGDIDRLIEAIDDQGRVWSVPGMDCDVGDWKEYLASGGTVEPYVEPATRPASE
jgi:hypothetical protein